MKFTLLAFTLFLSTIALSAAETSMAPAGKKIHKEIKSGQIVVPAPSINTVTGKPASTDKSKAVK
jgi:hypothetical protein